MAGDIRVARDGDVLRITLDRPDRLNAAPPAMFDAIRDALGRLDGARAVLLAGGGAGLLFGSRRHGGADRRRCPGGDPCRADPPL